MSRSAAASRTERATTPSLTRPPMTSPASGPSDARPRLGFKPTRPQHDAGMRIEPPPSLACATGTRPAATAAAEPPLDPPVEWPAFHGLRVGPHATGSVVGTMPSSLQLVLPVMMKPALRSRVTRYES